MLSKSIVKQILLLRGKKERDEERLFVVEGDRIVREFIGSEEKVVMLIAKPEFISSLNAEQRESSGDLIAVSYDELKKISSLKTPHNAMAIIRMPDPPEPSLPETDELVVALDFMQDPGNLGTIIRAAAWFGIERIICSDNCVDLYNPKVIQATMGAILNVRVIYTDLELYLRLATERGFPVFGTLLEGDPVYSAKLAKNGIVLLGNESRGISAELIPLITHKITIPKFTTAKRGIESLNAGMAASIILSEFARR